MKFLLATILSLALTVTVSAQRFEVEGGSKNLKVELGETISTPLKIKNLSGETLHLVIRRINKNIGSSQNSYFCLGGKCFDKELDQLPVAYEIPKGDVSLKFETILESGISEGFSNVSYLIYDRNHPTEAVEFEINYTVQEQKETSLIYSSDDLQINDVYPNPVADHAVFDYNIVNRDVEAKILIHNVLGSVVGEYKLPYLENKVTINTDNFNPGVYFYTLYVDNDGVMTRKLIIRK